MRNFAFMFFALLLASCSMMPDWIAGPKKPPLPGERIPVLSTESELKADDSMKDVPVSVPAGEALSAWEQDGGNTASRPADNIAYGGSFTAKDSGHAGDANGWENGVLVPSPVVAAGKIFALDSKAYVSASDANNLSHSAWKYKGLVEEDKPDSSGGGVAYADNVLFVASGRGRMAALNAQDGSELWHVKLGNPLRSGPRVLEGNVYVLTVDNQLIALEASSGKTLWNHRGINETGGFLGLVTPAAAPGIVVAPYSSGEIKALKAGSGDEAWSDSLMLPRRTIASAIFSGIDANPVIANGVVFASGNGGITAANDLTTGQHLWEQQISSMNTPWVAGDFLYVLTTESELACLSAKDGRIKWVQKLPRYANAEDKKEPYNWSGPLMADGALLVAGAHGVLLSFSPEDGKQLASHAIPGGVYDAPIIVGNTLYLLSADATLHALK